MYRAAILAGLCAAAPAAAAAVGDWRLNEVVTAGPSGDGAIRFVELYTPVDACWFPSTRLDVYDADGHVTGQVAPYPVSTCFGAGSYVVLGTAQAGAAFGFTPDVTMLPALPAAAGQLCFASSTTTYDCVRWGAITTPVHDFLGASDDSSASAPPGGIALARTQVTHVVADDWALQTPTPRAPNDGSPWIPPDAAPPADAAPPLADAGPPDAVVDARPRPDARDQPDATEQRYLDLDPGGGACGCRSTTPGGAIPIVLVMFVVFRPADRRMTRRRATKRS